MLISELVESNAHRPKISCRPTDDVRQVLEKVREASADYALVWDKGKLVGVVTRRDLLSVEYDQLKRLVAPVDKVAYTQFIPTSPHDPNAPIRHYRDGMPD